MSQDDLIAVLESAKQLAKRYRELTGRPLGITGEVAEYEAARLLGLELAGVRAAGYDAVRHSGREAERIQIKGRCVLPGSKPSQRMSRIDLSKPFDAVLLVLLNDDLEATEIWEASREAVEAALTAPGSRSRNERGALGIPKFKSIGEKVWPSDVGADDAIYIRG